MKFLKRAAVALGLSALVLLIFFSIYSLVSHAQAGECYSWQIMTCGGNTTVIWNKHQETVGYLERRNDGSIRILGKDLSVRGYIDADTVLDVHRRETFEIEGLPERYSPILE